MTQSIRDFLSQEQIDSIRKPIESALTLPANAFTDEKFYQLEIDKIYKKHWVAALFESEVENPGDIQPFEVCGIPLLAVRGQDKAVRVFHNICPYDGCMAAIDPATNLDAIETPYHGWTYDLEGTLIKTPYWDGTKEGNLEALAGKEVNLVPVHTEVFLNTVFVNLSETPEPFANFVAPLYRAMEEYDLDKGVSGQGKDGKTYIAQKSVNTNWKTFFENACVNVLHENFVHDLYRVSPEVPRIKEDNFATFNNIIDGKLMALGYNRLDFPETYPHMEGPHLGKADDQEPVNETFGTLYPNFYVSASSQFIEIALLLPQGAEKVEQKAIYHYHNDVATDKELLEVRDMIAGGFAGAFMEDGRITEAVQKARRSPVYQQKFYAPFWDGMHHHLNKLIIDDLDTES